MLEREYDAWRERDEPRSARALWGLAWVEFWAGRSELAADYAARAHDIAIQYGLEVPQDHLPIAVIAVHRGQLELARRAFASARSSWRWRCSAPTRRSTAPSSASPRSGVADPSAAALDWLGTADRRAAELGWREPSVRWWTADHVELLLERGRGEDAVPPLDVWEADAARVAREWVLAHVTRCRGLVAAARGDVERALDLLAQAVAEHEARRRPVRPRPRAARARHRQTSRRQKRPAREAIEAALEGFETIGAARLGGQGARRARTRSAGAPARRD